MRADPDGRRRRARHLVVLLLVVALLTACGGVQIFDSFGEARSPGRASPAT